MTEHAVVISGGGPTGLMLAGELALAGVDVAIVERRPNQDLAGSRAGGLHSRTLEILDQRGIAGRFIAEGQKAQVAAFGAGTFSTATVQYILSGPDLDRLTQYTDKIVKDVEIDGFGSALAGAFVISGVCWLGRIVHLL